MPRTVPSPRTSRRCDAAWRRSIAGSRRQGGGNMATRLTSSIDANLTAPRWTTAGCRLRCAARSGMGLVQPRHQHKAELHPTANPCSVRCLQIPPQGLGRSTAAAILPGRPPRGPGPPSLGSRLLGWGMATQGGRGRAPTNATTQRCRHGTLCQTLRHSHCPRVTLGHMARGRRGGHTSGTRAPTSPARRQQSGSYGSRQVK